MSDKTFSQVQQFTQMYTGWAEAALEQVAKLQGAVFAQSQLAIDEGARLAKAQLAYANALQEGFMKLSLDARKAG